MLTYRVHECYDDEVDFLDALRSCNDVANFTADERTEAELHEIKQDLHRIDDALRKLIEMNPTHRKTYLEYHREAEQAIEKQILRLGLWGVRKGKL